ncbi:nucleoside deaminase [Elioraea tepida]|uniref:nucleoside deaminase n=1 Tax=Elioraea tepida TaxID=2843330 RepID=UPI002E2850F7|nr:nucleoside deaminase [Elioraea tepida]
MEGDAAMMREAIRLSVASVTEGGGPFGCVIVRDGRIVGQGANRVTLDNDPTAHAEVVAIRDACRRLGSFQLAGCDVYASLRALPDVPRRALLGAAEARVLRRDRRRRRSRGLR